MHNRERGINIRIDVDITKNKRAQHMRDKMRCTQVHMVRINMHTSRCEK